MALVDAKIVLAVVSISFWGKVSLRPISKAALSVTSSPVIRVN